jgi:hypothetical protein
VASAANSPAAITVYRGAYDFFPTGLRVGIDDFLPQNVPPMGALPPSLPESDLGAAPLNPLGST